MSAKLQHVMGELVDEGEVVEQADPETFFTAPRHERSQRFLEQIL